MSPEFLIDGHGLSLAKNLFDKKLLGFLAIDESHCLSCWGHDFRPPYLKIVEFRKLLPSIPIVAVTATAKETVVKEIINFLQLKNPKIIRANFDRPNLFIECKPLEKFHRKNIHKLIEEYILKYKEDRIIVYVNTRKETEDYSEALNKLYLYNISSPYHAGLTKKNKEKIQSDFINNECKVIISTIAFGMGIDQIVKCVLIIGCPSSIEEYYQQIGRGGRDGLECETVFYYDKSKKVAKEYILKKETNSYYKLANMRNVDEYFYTTKCRRQYILDYLGLSKSYFAYNQFTCKMCDNCTKYKLTDITNYLMNNKINKKIENIIFDFKLNKILNDWKKYIEFKNYTLETIPDGMRIKLRLNNFDDHDIIYDTYDNIDF
jgi:RecQ family ATP-dependent DNA helicase